jgi:hypothetical protein
LLRNARWAILSTVTELELALKDAQRAYEEAVARRTEAIVEAVRGDMSMRRVSQLAHCSRDEVRRITKSIAITYVLDDVEYELTQDVTRMLAYKAAGYSRNAFPGDVKRLGAGDGWLEGAGQLDRDLERVRQGLVDEPVTLTREAALALYQILRITHMGRPSRLTELWDALAPQFRTSERGDK